MFPSSAAAVCRVCLAVDVPMYNIADTPLQLVYEKLTNTLLRGADRRPAAACYVCRAQLHRSRKLMLTAVKAENILTAISERFHEVTKEIVLNVVDREAVGLCGSLTFSSAECLDNVMPIKVTVKIEPKVEDASSDTDNSETEGSLQARGADPLEDVLPSARSEPATDVADAETEEQKQMEGSSRNREHRSKQSRPQCALSSRHFRGPHALRKQTRTHTEKKPYECDVCQHRFSDISNLKTHLRTHTGEKPYECNVCRRCFSNISSLKTHLRTHTGEKPYECNVCRRCFSNISSLKKHLRTHTGGKPFECDVCHRRFSQICNLKRHLRIHTGEKPYECDVCRRCFSRISCLKTHLRTHTGEKPYECNVCRRRFSRISCLKRHSRTHTGEKPFECNTCQRRFNQKITLQSHIRTHTGEKPYECDICQRRFCQKGNLNVHIRTHTGETI